MLISQATSHFKKLPYESLQPNKAFISIEIKFHTIQTKYVHYSFRMNKHGVCIQVQIMSRVAKMVGGLGAEK